MPLSGHGPLVRPPWCYAEALRTSVFGIFLLEPGVVTHRSIDSASDVVLATKVQPGPRLVLDTASGIDVFAPFCRPSRGQVLILQLGTLEQWG